MNLNVSLIASTSSLKSGASWSLLRLAIELKKLGVNVIVILPTGEQLVSELNKQQIPTYIVNQHTGRYWYKDLNSGSELRVKTIARSILNKIAYIRIAHILKKNNIQIVHMNTLTSFVAAKAAVKLKLKVVWHIREFMEEDLNLTFCNKEQSYKLINNSSQIIAISSSIKEKYSKVLNNSNIKVVYNGIDIDNYFCKRMLFTNHKLKIAIIGRVTEQKGQMEYLQAIKMLPDSIKENIQSYIIGDANSEEYGIKIQNYVRENNMQSIVTFTGFKKDVAKYMKSIDILCSCSKCEAFGRTTVEGMLAGCVIIGTDTGATPEIVDNGENGYIYESGNPQQLSKRIEYIYNHRKEAQEIAIKGQIKAKQNFTAEKNASEIFEIYKEILEQ